MVNEVYHPELWNNLPEDIKSVNSIGDFKRKLKTISLSELMNRDVFISYLIFYLLCTFIYFVVSV